MKPSQFSRPSMPATVPVKHEEMNLTLYIELLLKKTWGANNRCCWSSGVRADIRVRDGLTCVRGSNNWSEIFTRSHTGRDDDECNVRSPGGKSCQGRRARSDRYRRTTLYHPPREPSALCCTCSRRIDAISWEIIRRRHKLEAANSHTVWCARSYHKTMRSRTLQRVRGRFLWPGCRRRW